MITLYRSYLYIIVRPFRLCSMLGSFSLERASTAVCSGALFVGKWNQVIEYASYTLLELDPFSRRIEGRGARSWVGCRSSALLRGHKADWSEEKRGEGK